MGDYVLQVNYREDEEPVRIPLLGYSPGDAETAHQALETEIHHAQSLNAPVIFSTDSSDISQRAASAGVPIDPSRVTGVDLVEATPGE